MSVITYVKRHFDQLVCKDILEAAVPGLWDINKTFVEDYPEPRKLSVALMYPGVAGLFNAQRGQDNVDAIFASDNMHGIGLLLGVVHELGSDALLRGEQGQTNFARIMKQEKPEELARIIYSLGSLSQEQLDTLLTHTDILCTEDFIRDLSSFSSLEEKWNHVLSQCTPS